ncbi:hypothetical protein Goshw_026250, partial [Gossypium schwendimanii]|nr:hypothetical protein [Gossypium schwendimanii]
MLPQMMRKSPENHILRQILCLAYSLRKSSCVVH